MLRCKSSCRRTSRCSVASRVVPTSNAQSFADSEVSVCSTASGLCSRGLSLRFQMPLVREHRLLLPSSADIISACHGNRWRHVPGSDIAPAPRPYLDARQARTTFGFSSGSRRLEHSPASLLLNSQSQGPSSKCCARQAAMHEPAVPAVPAGVIYRALPAAAACINTFRFCR